MAVLNAAKRLEAYRDFIGVENIDRTTIALTKDEIKAAINAVDDWVETNQASFLSAFPSPSSTTLSGKQKLMIFLYVVTKRKDIA